MIIVSYAASSCQPNSMSLINHESLATGNKGGLSAGVAKLSQAIERDARNIDVAWVNGKASRPTQSECGCGQPKLSWWLTHPCGVRPGVTGGSKQSNKRQLPKRKNDRVQVKARQGEQLARSSSTSAQPVGWGRAADR